MGKKLFRYMFENAPNAIIMTGCIWDKENDGYMLSVYSCEFINRRQEAEKKLHIFQSKRMIDLFIMGDFTVSDCRRLLYGIFHNGVHTVILPYILPEKRRHMMEQIDSNGREAYELHQFLQDPDDYLKAHVSEHYFIYGNGKQVFDSEGESGFSLERQNSELLSKVISKEGKELSIRKAGWFVKNHLLFYLNDCGQGFGYSKIAFFCAPYETNRIKMDMVFQAVLYDSKQRCHVDISEDGGKCALRCMLYQDHHVFRHPNDDGKKLLRLGVLIFPAIAVEEQMGRLCDAFRDLFPMIRVLSMHSVDYREFWLKMVEKQQEAEELFWLCPVEAFMEAEPPKEIFLKNSRNRLVVLNENYGCCFTGYLAKKEVL